MIKSEKRLVKINFTSPVLGTSPTDQEIYSKFIANKENEIYKKEAKRNGNTEAELDAELDTLPDPGPTTGYHKDDVGLFLYNYQIKGFFKNAGNVLKDQDDIKVKNLRNKLNDFLFIFPRKVYIRPERKVADTIIERPLIADTMRGKRVALASSEAIIPPAHIIFEIELINHKEIKWDHIIDLLAYGSRMGVGQWRNAGHGQFDYSFPKPGDGISL